VKRLMVKKRVSSVTELPAVVLSFKWLRSVEGKVAQRLPCSVCGRPIGLGRFGLAHVLVDGEERFVRLCEVCGKIAEQEVSDENV